MRGRVDRHPAEQILRLGLSFGVWGSGFRGFGDVWGLGLWGFGVQGFGIWGLPVLLERGSQQRFLYFLTDTTCIVPISTPTQNLNHQETNVKQCGGVLKWPK